MHTKCNCLCYIVPPHITKELEKNLKGKLIGTPVEDFRAKRAAAIAATPILSKDFISPSALPVHVAVRKVFNLAHGTTLNIHLSRAEGGAAVADPVVNAAYDNAGKVRDFYLTQFAYNSFDNHGSDLLLNVHYSTGYNNAFWDGHEMIFGDGDNVVFTNFASSLDVTGHELTHGVVQYLAGLIYDGQPGALNEHMADVFGVTIRQYYQHQSAAPATANWLIGDTIMGPSLHGQAIRNMKAPGTAYNNPLMGKDPQPAHMKNYYKGSGDNHGVHINSGIPNKVFCDSAIAIGNTLSAALVWFETLKTLHSTDTFAIFKTKTLAAATILTTAHRVPASTPAKISTAFTNVGL